MNLFSKSSQSFQRLNPHIGLPGDKNSLAVNSASSNGIVVRQRGFKNKSEAEYAMILEAQKQRGEISGWTYEGVKLKIGEGCWYCPDFFVWGDKWDYANGISIPVRISKFIEVKGFLRDDARVKFLSAKEQHKWASFEMWRKDRKLGWQQIK